MLLVNSTYVRAVVSKLMAVITGSHFVHILLLYHWLWKYT